VSITKVAGIISRRSVPAWTLVITVMITIVVIVRSALITLVVVAADDEVRAAALVYPDSIAVSAPCTAFDARLLAVLSHHSKIVRVAVSRDFTFLMLAVRRTVKSLRAGGDANEH
jgi:hypothetical protein